MQMKGVPTPERKSNAYLTVANPPLRSVLTNAMLHASPLYCKYSARGLRGAGTGGPAEENYFSGQCVIWYTAHSLCIRTHTFSAALFDAKLSSSLGNTLVPISGLECSLLPLSVLLL